MLRLRGSMHFHHRFCEDISVDVDETGHRQLWSSWQDKCKEERSNYTVSFVSSPVSFDSHLEDLLQFCRRLKLPKKRSQPRRNQRQRPDVGENVGERPCFGD